MKRRQFIQQALATVGAVALFPLIGKAEPSRRKKTNDSELVSLDDNTAKAVGYVEDSKKSTTSKGNNCSNCMLYNKKSNVKGKETGSCSLFPNKLVYGNGYCNSWAKKA